MTTNAPVFFFKREIVNLFCLAVSNIVGRWDPPGLCWDLIFEAEVLLRKSSYWKSVGENLYGRSIPQVLVLSKSIRQKCHLTQNIEVFCQKFVNTLDLVDKNIDLNLKGLMSPQSADHSAIQSHSKFPDACKAHHDGDPWPWVISPPTALLRYEFEL